MSFNLTESPWTRAGRKYSVRVRIITSQLTGSMLTVVQDLWKHKNVGVATRSWTEPAVPAHGVVALLLKDAGNEPADTQPPCSVWWQCTRQDGWRVPGS